MYYVSTLVLYVSTGLVPVTVFLLGVSTFTELLLPPLLFMYRYVCLEHRIMSSSKLHTLILLIHYK